MTEKEKLFSKKKSNETTERSDASPSLKLKKLMVKLIEKKLDEVLEEKVEALVEEKLKEKIKSARLVFGVEVEEKGETNPFREKNKKILEKSAELSKLHRMNGKFASEFGVKRSPLNEAGINLAKNMKANDALKNALLETAMNFSPEDAIADDGDEQFNENFEMGEK